MCAKKKHKKESAASLVETRTATLSFFRIYVYSRLLQLDAFNYGLYHISFRSDVNRLKL